MNFQDAARAYFRKALGVTSGSYAELATRYWKGKLDGTITEGPSEISSDNISDATTVGKNLIKASDAAAARTAIGAADAATVTDLVARVQALESAEG